VPASGPADLRPVSGAHAPELLPVAVELDRVASGTDRVVEQAAESRDDLRVCLLYTSDAADE